MGDQVNDNNIKQIQVKAKIKRKADILHKGCFVLRAYSLNMQHEIRST
jgi:hypothetical protein